MTPPATRMTTEHSAPRTTTRDEVEVVHRSQQAREGRTYTALGLLRASDPKTVRSTSTRSVRL